MKLVHRLSALVMLGAVASLPAAWAQTGRLNDTGQTTCTTNANCAATQEDGRYGRDAAQAAGALPAKLGGGAAGFDFSCVLWNGTVINGPNCTAGLTANTGAAASTTPTTDWACTKDNVTGLVWSLQTVSGLTWSAAMNTAIAGRPIPVANAAGRCGYSTGWRLPTRRELLSIVRHGASNPAIDGNYFPATAIYYYWSSDAYARNAAGAWSVFFGDGHAYAYGKTITSRVRLVRSGQ